MAEGGWVLLKLLIKDCDGLSTRSVDKVGKICFDEMDFFVISKDTSRVHYFKSL